VRNLISLFFVFIIGCTFLISKTYASWAYAFVVYDGNIYVISETHIELKQIGKQKEVADNKPKRMSSDILFLI
jgi:hypothetical protein